MLADQAAEAFAACARNRGDCEGGGAQAVTGRMHARFQGHAGWEIRRVVGRSGSIYKLEILTPCDGVSDQDVDPIDTGGKRGKG